MIKIYTAESTASYISTDDTAPLVTAHNKKRFHPFSQKLYLRNDSTSVWVSNIRLYATATSGEDLMSGTGYFGIKFSVGPNEPTERRWNAISYNSTAQFSVIGTVGASDTSTFLPFWLRVDVSPGTPVSFHCGQLVLNYTENAV